MNIRSLDLHWGEFVAMISSLDVSFDVICLTEIGTKNLEERAALLSNKYQFQYEAPVDNKFGGTGIFIKNDLQITERTDLKIQKDHDLEIENIWYEITGRKNKVVIGTIYRHPGIRNNVTKFIEKAEKTINTLANNNIRSIVCGDLNIDALKIQINENTNNFFNMLSTNNFTPTITLPTRITDHTITLIDHILIKTTIKDIENTLTSGNIYSDITDHLPNFLIIHNDKSKPEPEERPYVRLYGEQNMAKFKDLFEKDWGHFFENEDPNKAVEILNTKFSHAYNKSFPLKRVSRNRAKDKKWMTLGLRISLNKKAQLYKKKIKSPTQKKHRGPQKV